MADEKIIFRAKLHRAIFFWPFFNFVFGIFLVYAFMPSGAMALFGAFFILLGLVGAAENLKNYVTSEFVLTDKRVVMKTGWIRRKPVEFLLNKVESIQVKQGFMGRRLDYGTVTISGIGGSKSTLKKISSPLEFQRMIQEQMSTSTCR